MGGLPGDRVRLTGVGSGPAFADRGLEIPGEKGGYEPHHLGWVGIVAGDRGEVDGPIVFGRKPMQRGVEHDRVAGKDGEVLGTEESEQWWQAAGIDTAADIAIIFWRAPANVRSPRATGASTHSINCPADPAKTSACDRSATRSSVTFGQLFDHMASNQSTVGEIATTQRMRGSRSAISRATAPPRLRP